MTSPREAVSIFHSSQPFRFAQSELLSGAYVHVQLAQFNMNSNAAYCIVAFLGLTGFGEAGPMSRRELQGTSMCSASLSAVISPCADNACIPAMIEVGNTVTFQVCVENLSFEIPGSSTTTPVTATLKETTQMEIFLACDTSECTGGYTGPTTFQYQSYTPTTGGSSSFTLGATSSCPNTEMCGLLTPLRLVSICGLSLEPTAPPALGDPA